MEGGETEKDAPPEVPAVLPAGVSGRSAAEGATATERLSSRSRIVEKEEEVSRVPVGGSTKRQRVNKG